MAGHRGSTSSDPTRDTADTHLRVEARSEEAPSAGQVWGRILGQVGLVALPWVVGLGIAEFAAIGNGAQVFAAFFALCAAIVYLVALWLIVASLWRGQPVGAVASSRLVNVVTGLGAVAILAASGFATFVLVTALLVD